MADMLGAPALLVRLDAPELARLSFASRNLSRASTRCWPDLLRRDLLYSAADALLLSDGAPARHLYSAAMTLYSCPLCRQRLVAPRRGGWARCVCVARRGARLPLTVGSFKGRQNQQGCLDGFSSFPIMSEARRLLEGAFDVRYAEADRLSDDFLESVDLLIVDMVAAPDALRQEEVQALQKFVADGGFAILSAFSNWSASGDFHNSCVSWLGARPRRSAFGGRKVYNFRSHAERMDVRELLEGPFGRPGQFTNVGETKTDLLPNAADQGVHSFTPALHLFGPIGRGQVLVHSNLHWMVDSAGWNGGTIRENSELFQNVAAAACRALLAPEELELTPDSS